jgi:hypothetical protein
MISCNNVRRTGAGRNSIQWPMPWNGCGAFRAAFSGLDKRVGAHPGRCPGLSYVGLSARRTVTRLSQGWCRLLATQESTAISSKLGPRTGRGLQSASTSFCLATFKRRKRRVPALVVLDGHYIRLPVVNPANTPVNPEESSLIQPDPTKNDESLFKKIDSPLAG